MPRFVWHGVVPMLAVRAFEFLCTSTDGATDARSAIQASSRTVFCNNIIYTIANSNNATCNACSNHIVNGNKRFSKCRDSATWRYKKSKFGGFQTRNSGTSGSYRRLQEMVPFESLNAISY